MQTWKFVPSLEQLFHKFSLSLSFSLPALPTLIFTWSFSCTTTMKSMHFYAILVNVKVLLFLPLHYKTSQSNIQRWSHSCNLIIYLSELAEKFHRYFNVISMSAGLKTPFITLSSPKCTIFLILLFASLKPQWHLWLLTHPCHVTSTSHKGLLIISSR